jgi:tetratricopeptide (TPR) repeat protein
VSASSLRVLVNGLGIVARTFSATDEELSAIKTPEPNGPDCLWQLLERAPKGWVLIVDNADDIEFLAKPPESGDEEPPVLAEGNGWARFTHRGLVIVTSRQREKAFWPKRTVVYEVKTLSEAQAAQILVDEASGAGTPAEAKALAKRLGGLPLALHLAGRYLGSTFAIHRTFEAYHKALNANSGEIERLDRGETAERRVLMLTWELSLDALAAKGIPHARPLLRLLSCFSPAVLIPGSMLQSAIVGNFLAKALPPAPNRPRPRADVVLEGLLQLGLIDSPQPSAPEFDDDVNEPYEGGGVVIHPVVADTNRAHLAAPGEAGAGESLIRHSAVKLIAAAMVGLDPAQQESWPTFRILTPHLQALLSDSAPKLEAPDLSILIELAGSTATAYGYMKSAGYGIELIRLALVHDRKGADNTDPAILTTREHLGYLLQSESEDADAEKIFREVLQSRLRKLPPDHPDILRARHNVLASSWRQADWAEASRMFQDLLNDEQLLLGSQDPVTLRTRLEFARLHQALGNWPDAESLLQPVVADAMWLYGANHAFVLAAKECLDQVRREDKGGRGAQPTDAGRQFSILQPGTPALEDQTAAALLHKGIILMETSPEQALSEFEQVVSRYGADEAPQTQRAVGKAMFMMAEILRDMKRPDEAVRAYSRMAERFAGDATPEMRVYVARALSGQADILADLEGPEEEAAALDELTGQFATDPTLSIRQLVGGAYLRKAFLRRNQPEQAMRELERAVEIYQGLDDDYPGDYEDDLKATRHSRELMKLELVNFQIEKATVLYDQGQKADALAVLRELDARFGHDPSPTIRSQLANALLKAAFITHELSGG